jgi:indolepyruvate decarboxylase
VTSVHQALLRALKGHGAQEIFGIPGDFALPFFKAVEDCGLLPLYTLSHEPAVGFAADAAARMRGGLGVAAVTYGAGALNMVNAVAAAYAEKSPVVVVSGAPGREEIGRGLLLHHQAKALDSQYRIYAEVTCAQARLDDARTAPLEIARVLRDCLTYSRPVYLELPRDAGEIDCAEVVPAPEPPFDTEALAACADEILARLRASRSPVLMVGVEVRRFGVETRAAELARRLGIPVVTSLLGRGLLAGTGTSPEGTYLGAAGAPQIARLVEESDALFLLGVIVSDTNLGVSARRIDLRHAIRALDRRVLIGHHIYPDIPLGPLLDALLERQPPGAPRRVRCAPAAIPRGLAADEAPLQPSDIATAINDLMDERGRLPVAADVGDSLFVALDIAPTAHCAPAYYATMGFGVPAGLGMQAASGARPIVLVGDGAFQMTGWELGNCARYGWDPIVVVLNNGGWQMLRAFQPAARFNELGEWNYAALASALGGEGARVRTRGELANALRAAHARRGRFQLIEAMVPRGAMSATLERYARSISTSKPPSARGVPV